MLPWKGPNVQDQDCQKYMQLKGEKVLKQCRNVADSSTRKGMKQQYLQSQVHVWQLQRKSAPLVTQQQKTGK